MKPISLGGSPLGCVRHVCALFHDDEEEYRVLLPFVQDGFASGDKAVHIVNPEQQANHLHRLTMAGIDTVAAQTSGQLDLRVNTDIYLRDGQFDQDRMLRAFEDMLDGNGRKGYLTSRILCRMDWAADGRRHVANLIEFESRVNDVWLRHNDAVVCTYRLDRFSGDTIIDILRTHPLVIIGGILHQNPFYIPPSQFLPEFQARKTAGMESNSAGHSG